MRSALAVHPDHAYSLSTLGFTLIANNQPADAIPVLEKAVSVSHRSPAVIGVLIRAYAHAGRRKDALRLLAELQQRRKAGYVPAGAFVNAYLGLVKTTRLLFGSSKPTKSNRIFCNSSKCILTSIPSATILDLQICSAAPGLNEADHNGTRRSNLPLSRWSDTPSQSC